MQPDLDLLTKKIKEGVPAIICTDSVYGIIAKDSETIYRLKKRPKEKKNILFINDINQMGDDIPEDLRNLGNKYWPGQLTIIYKNQGYRIPNNPLLKEIVEKTGPLYSSSANISGKEPVKSIEEAKIVFKDEEVIYVNLSIKSSNIPSTIYSYDEKKILRQGSIYLE